MALRVRPMAAEDAAAACAILNEIIGIGGTTAYQTPFDEAGFAEAFLTGLKVVCCHVVLDEAGEVAGFQLLGQSPERPQGCAFIASFTRRDPPVKGAGSALFAVTREVARARGYSEIDATIRADNAPGLGYYSKMGFVDHHVIPALPLDDGRPVDRISKRFAL